MEHVRMRIFFVARALLFTYSSLSIHGSLHLIVFIENVIFFYILRINHRKSL
jgi:hypothetical protein